MLAAPVADVSAYQRIRYFCRAMRVPCGGEDGEEMRR